MNRKLFSVLLVLCMVLSSFSGTAWTAALFGSVPKYVKYSRNIDMVAHSGAMTLLLPVILLFFLFFCCRSSKNGL